MNKHSFFVVGLFVFAVSMAACSSGSNEVSQDCFEVTKEIAAEYVDAARNQPGTSASAFVNRSLNGCTESEREEAISLFVVTVGAAAAAFEQGGQEGDGDELGADLNSRDALLVGLEPICEGAKNVETSDSNKEDSNKEDSNKENSEGGSEGGRQEERLPSEENIGSSIGEALGYRLSDDALSVCQQSRAVVDAADEQAAPLENETPLLNAYVLRYEVEGSGRASVRYTAGSGQELSEQVVLPWSWQDPSGAPYPTIFIENAEQGNVSCSIFINDELKTQGETFCGLDAGEFIATSPAGGGLVPPLTAEEQAEILQSLQ